MKIKRPPAYSDLQLEQIRRCNEHRFESELEQQERTDRMVAIVFLIVLAAVLAGLGAGAAWMVFGK